jgi:hypothetical protein
MKPRRNRVSDVVGFYKRLSPLARRLLWVVLAMEAVLIVATERDIHRRPAEGIRGPKLLWRVVATQNVVGPAAYFGLGRRPAR